MVWYGRIGFFAHRPQDVCAQNCWPHRPQSFNTVEFQLQPLLECQYIVYEAVIKERNGLHEALNYQLFQISQTQPQDAIRASAQFILSCLHCTCTEIYSLS